MASELNRFKFFFFSNEKYTIMKCLQIMPAEMGEEMFFSILIKQLPL